MRGCLDTPLEPIELTLQDAHRANIEINEAVEYTGEPDGVDNWQIPRWTWDMRRGDCEDIAILKYGLLLKSGLPEEALRLSIGNIAADPQPLGHAWCAAYLEGKWRVLDNKFNQIIQPMDYINWRPVAAVWGSSCVLYSRQFTINDRLRGA